MRVLVTRPILKAEALAEKLAALGHDPVMCPLLRIEHIDTPLDLKGIETLVFTSRNAVDAARSQIENFAGHVFAVGEKTATALGQLGLDPHIASGDVRALGELIVRQCDPSAGVILHPCGEHTAGNLKAQLRSAGFRAERVVVYRAVAHQKLPDGVIKAIKSKEIGAALFYSPRTAATFKTLVSAAGLLNWFQGIRAIVMSDNVAEALKGLDFEVIKVAREKSETAMLEALGSGLN